MAQNVCATCGAPLRPNESRCRRCGRPFDPLSPGVFRSDEAPPVFAPGAGQDAVAVTRRASASYVDENALRGTPYEPVGLLGWIGILLLMLVPGVNIVLMIVWACGGCRKYTKRNFARALLILLFFALILFLIAWLLFGSFWQRYLNLLYYYW